MLITQQGDISDSKVVRPVHSLQCTVIKKLIFSGIKIPPAGGIFV